MLWRFSNLCDVSGIVLGGFFLRKKPLGRWGLSLPRLENRYNSAPLQYNIALA
jgi:hypothetical protein